MNSIKTSLFFFFCVFSISQIIAQEPVPENSTGEPEKRVIISAPPPPPPPPPPSGQLEIFKVVENMPFLEECAGMKDRQNQEYCNEEQLVEKIYQNMDYPAMAIENGVEGFVHLSYIVSKEGNISNVKVRRDIGAECGQTAKSALEKVAEATKYRPGMQRSRVVAVEMFVEVEFSEEKLKEVSENIARKKVKAAKEKPTRN